MNNLIIMINLLDFESRLIIVKHQQFVDIHTHNQKDQLHNHLYESCCTTVISNWSVFMNNLITLCVHKDLFSW